MKEWIRNNRLYLLITVLSVIILYSFICYLINPEFINSDAFYHFSISKLLLGKLSIGKIPQIDDLYWKNYFIDKEHLYHIFSSIFYYLGGETGVKVLSGILGLLSIFVLSLSIHKKTHKWESYLLILALLTQYAFSYRFPVVRPHLLAILIFSLNILGILKGRKGLIILSSFLFPLAYHALYILLINLCLAFIIYPKLRKGLFFALIAFIAGTIINPYFPGTLNILWLTLLIALNSSSIHIAERAPELQFPPFSQIWSFYLFPIFILGLGIYLWLRSRKEFLKDKQFIFLGLLLLVWIFPMVKSFRSVEYFYPVSILFLSSLIIYFKKSQAKFMILLLVFINCINMVNLLSSNFIKSKDYRYMLINDYLNAVEQIPDSEQGKVFNCRWSTGQYVLYKRENMKFVDLLDPYLLYSEGRELHELRSKLNWGNMIDPFAVIHDVFKSNYVLCSKGKLNFQLDHDPRFIRIYPQKLYYSKSINTSSLGDTIPALYKVVPEGNTPFNNAEIKFAGQTIKKVLNSISYKNIKGIFQKKCMNFTVHYRGDHPERVKYLGIGGSWPVRLSTGQTYNSDKKSALIKYLVPISPSKLTTHFSLCRSDDPLKKLSYSYYTQEDINTYCRSKTAQKVYGDKERKYLRTFSNNISLDLCH